MVHYGFLKPQKAKPRIRDNHCTFIFYITLNGALALLSGHGSSRNCLCWPLKPEADVLCCHPWCYIHCCLWSLLHGLLLVPLGIITPISLTPHAFCSLPPTTEIRHEASPMALPGTHAGAPLKDKGVNTLWGHTLSNRKWTPMECLHLALWRCAVTQSYQVFIKLWPTQGYTPLHVPAFLPCLTALSLTPASLRRPSLVKF